MALRNMIAFLSCITPLMAMSPQNSHANDFHGLYNITQYNYTFNYFNESFSIMLNSGIYWNYKDGTNYWDIPNALNYWNVNGTFNVSYKLLISKIQQYYEWVIQYDKFDNYFINASDNYLGIFQRIVQFIINDELIDELNSYESLKNITVYAMDKNGTCYTNEIDYIYTAPSYNHTWFSDLLPDDMTQFLGEIPNVDVNAASDSSCTNIDYLPSSSTTTRVNQNTYCPSVGYQQYGDCWSWSSTTQSNCNYNQKSYNYNSTSYTNTKFSKLYTDFCSDAGDVINGGSAYYANIYFVSSGGGDCSYYKYPYPGAGREKDEDQECEGCQDDLTKASACYTLNSGDKSTDFKNAHYWVGYKGYAMSISFYVGGSFYNIDSTKGQSPVDTVCDVDDESSLGGHAMTIVGTSNKWDYEYGSLKIQNSWGSSTWGDNGYFWLSREAYVKCGCSISFNTFGETITNDGKVVDIDGWTPSNTTYDNRDDDDGGSTITDDINNFIDTFGIGKIIGIACGGLVLLILICIMCRCLKKKKRKEQGVSYVAYQRMEMN